MAGIVCSILNFFKSITRKDTFYLNFYFSYRLVGDVLLATGFLSYCGPYNQEFRSKLIKFWMRILKSHAIPFTENLNITNMLVETATVPFYINFKDIFS